MADTAEPSYFLKNLVGVLTPHFMTYAFEPGRLNTDVITTLRSFGARTRLELLCAGLAVAFGFSALETLAETRNNVSQLTPAANARYKTCAVSLNRACQQNINALNARLACDLPTAKPATAPQPETVNDLSDEEADQRLRQAQDTLEARRNRLAQPSNRQGSRGPRAGAHSHLFTPAPQAPPL